MKILHKPALEVVRSKVRPPLGIVFGSPREAAEMLAGLGLTEARCYQMDLYQAERLREELDQRNLAIPVDTAADLWDLETRFHTLVYLAAEGGERDLKIDMVEQAFHVLRPQGQLIVLSSYEHDQLFPGWLKKIFGKVHVSPSQSGSVFWCHRHDERPRRRHEVTFHARVGEAPSLHILSRPGVFSYGRFDDGARALVETMQINPGEKVLDLGCGCGTNGIFAARQCGPSGQVTFVDSNLRAVVLAELNARANGVDSFQTLASARIDNLPTKGFDVVLANPPYYAQLTIAELFIERSHALLRPGGRIYLVTKQPDQVGPMMAERFGQTGVAERRGYAILSATKT